MIRLLHANVVIRSRFVLPAPKMPCLASWSLQLTRAPHVILQPGPKPFQPQGLQLLCQHTFVHTRHRYLEVGRWKFKSEAEKYIKLF